MCYRLKRENNKLCFTIYDAGTSFLGNITPGSKKFDYNTSYNNAMLKALDKNDEDDKEDNKNVIIGNKDKKVDDIKDTKDNKDVKENKEVKEVKEIKEIKEEKEKVENKGTINEKTVNKKINLRSANVNTNTTKEKKYISKKK